MTDHTILMTGSGAPGASGIIRSLRIDPDLEYRIVGVDMDPDAYGFTLVDEAYTVPPGDGPEYVPAIRDLSRDEDVDVVLPLTTNELQPLARHRDSFEARVMVSPLEALTVANHKGQLYEFLAAHDFSSTPTFHRVESETSFVNAVEELGYPERRVCFKPPVASGMRGFRILDATGDDLSRLLEEKPGTGTTTLEDVLPILSSGESFPELVVMEYLPGEEYSVDVLARDDSVEPIVPRSRSNTRAGITFQGTVEKRPDLIEHARGICSTLGLEYNANLQFKYDVDGNAKLIEINPRVAGTIIMCTGAGANMPALGVRYALGYEPGPVSVEWGTRMARYWQEVFTAPDGSTYHVRPETSARNERAAGEQSERDRTDTSDRPDSGLSRIGHPASRRET